jgi:hypothetical protein
MAQPIGEPLQPKNLLRPVDPAVDAEFQRALPQIQLIVARRRPSWTLLSYMDWEDVAQQLLIHTWQKFHTYDPSRETNSKLLERWTNRLISNYLFNLKRDLQDKHARPCVGGGNANGKRCAYNGGGNRCEYTTSGIQCAECPAYALWQKNKEPLHNIKASLTLEHHTSEVNNIQSDFLDIKSKKQIVDQRMLERLSQWEGKIYTLLFIEHKTAAETSITLKKVASQRKRPLKPEDAVEYQAILGFQKRAKEMITRMVHEEDIM